MTWLCTNTTYSVPLAVHNEWRFLASTPTSYRLYGPYSLKTLNVSSSSCPCSSTQPWTRTGEWRRSSTESQAGHVTKIRGQLIHGPGFYLAQSFLYILDRRLAGTQRRYGSYGDEHLLLPGIELLFLVRPAHNLATLWIKLSRLGTNPYGGGTVWTNPVGSLQRRISRTRPDRPWGPPNLLHNGYRVIPGGSVAWAWR